MTASTVNDHGAVFVDGAVVGWVRADGCENDRCLFAIAAGRPFHAIPRGFGVTLGEYHYATRDEAIAAVVEASR